MTPYYLYKITNLFNGKLYIGITKNLERRWTVHCSKHSQCKRLKSAIDKYGKESFSKEVLCIGLKDYILDLEEKMIAAYDSTNLGYNICKGGKDYPSEHKIGNSSHTPVYVNNFWFPNRETALCSLNLKIANFYKWKKEGTLGEVVRRRVSDNGNKSPPVYIKGFWFPSNPMAMKVLNISRGQSFRLSKLLDDEPEDKSFDRNKRFPRPNSKPVYIDSVLYGSTKEAARETGIMPETIRRRIKNNWEGYRYADPI